MSRRLLSLASILLSKSDVNVGEFYHRADKRAKSRAQSSIAMRYKDGSGTVSGYGFIHGCNQENSGLEMSCRTRTYLSERASMLSGTLLTRRISANETVLLVSPMITLALLSDTCPSRIIGENSPRTADARGKTRRDLREMFEAPVRILRQK